MFVLPEKGKHMVIVPVVWQQVQDHCRMSESMQ